MVSTAGGSGVVVVGAGFGGLAVATELARRGLGVTVVDRHPYSTFQPLLYQVATAGLNLEDVAFPVRSRVDLRSGGNFVQGRMVAVDWDRKSVVLAGGDRVGFRRLVLATGATTSFYGVPGAREHALPLYTLADAARVRRRLVLEVEAGSRTREPLRVVVVGGGPTGVETAGAVAELRDALGRRDYPHLRQHGMPIDLLEMGPRLLAHFREPLSRYASRELQRRRVRVHTGRRVTSVLDGGLVTSEGEHFPCRLLVWAAGVGIPEEPHLGSLPRSGSGRLIVDPTLRLQGHPEAFAIGDVAAVAGAHGAELPQLAQPAIQAGRHVARELLRERTCGTPRPFAYHDRGTMATIGRRAAVVQLRGRVQLTGSPAWLAWLGLHLFALMGGRNRASVLINWAWRYLAWRRSASLVVGPTFADGGDDD